MTQSATTRSIFRMLPGHVYTPDGSGREPESLEVPYTLQSFTFTVSAAPDPVTAGDYEMIFVTPVDGTITVTYTASGAETPAELAAALAAAGTADPNVGGLFYFSANGLVVTAVAKSANLSIATPTTTVPGATTLTPALLTPAGAPSLRMGLWYVYGTAQANLAITGTPRGRPLAALPGAATTIDLLRGVIARPANQTQLSATFQDASTPDAYPAGQIAFGLNRGQICTMVDPASATMTENGQIHVVIAAGVYSVIGAVAAVADGANTIRVDNAPAGNILARVTAVEETLFLGGATSRCVLLKVNRTN